MLSVPEMEGIPSEKATTTSRDENIHEKKGKFNDKKKKENVHRKRS